MAPKRKRSTPARVTISPSRRTKSRTAGQAAGNRGRKATLYGAGVDAKDAPVRVQATLGHLLGLRRPAVQAPAAAADSGGGQAPAAAGDNESEKIQWDYDNGEGGADNALAPQAQRADGRVKYDLDKDALAILRKRGPEIYYVDASKLLIQIEHEGKLGEPVWVNERHVQAIEEAGVNA